MPLKIIKTFLKLEAASGIILFFAAFLAVVWANSPLAFLHQQFVEHFLFGINDGLMTLFFIVVGLELKRGCQTGQLANLQQVLLPLIAAIGGMIIPACIYYALNYSDPITAKGWATPVATDIAFAIGMLSLFSRRIPTSLKLFLLALAIFDDIGAIFIITFFHAEQFSVFYFLLSLLVIVILFCLRFFSIKALWIYVLGGVLLWVYFLFSGIHPTIAGVLFAFILPAQWQNKIETKLHPWVAYLVMPLFALANAGFSFQEVTIAHLQSSVTLGIVAGLFIGKQTGVFVFAWLAIKTKLAKQPEHCSWQHLYGAALFCGIGFTMSLFLGTLSFSHDLSYLVEVRLGVVIGSFLSALAGALCFSKFCIRRKVYQQRS